MIREGKTLPDDVLSRIPPLVEQVAADEQIIALYAFGSLADGRLKPLSDLDFGILLTTDLNKKERFDKHIALITTFTSTLATDEVDLIVLNDAPMRFSYHVVKSGKLLFCRDQLALGDHIEKTIKIFLDFKFFRDRFDQAFLNGIDHHG